MPFYDGAIAKALTVIVGMPHDIVKFKSIINWSNERQESCMSCCNAFHKD